MATSIVKSEEVKRAGEIGPQLLAALGAREHGKGPGPTEAADRRARAFALLVHAHDQIRRAFAFLRWDEEDADVIAPSLYNGVVPLPPIAIFPAARSIGVVGGSVDA
ncbi:hypothetical protein [Sorangium sp. So ce233]|uniref:hypothetical protein n=1 Tax=Sorangium sp. So ce233 TaxID=3133290 RepID=UPI003F5E5E81